MARTTWRIMGNPQVGGVRHAGSIGPWRASFCDTFLSLTSTLTHFLPAHGHRIDEDKDRAEVDALGATQFLCAIFADEYDRELARHEPQLLAQKAGDRRTNRLLPDPTSPRLEKAENQHITIAQVLCTTFEGLPQGPIQAVISGRSADDE